MGSINYYTSRKFVTLGYANNWYDYVKECKQYYLDDGYSDAEAEDLASNDYCYCQSEDYEIVKGMVESERFYFYDFEVRSGYYEGFSIYIDENINQEMYFRDYQEKLDAIKEARSIARILTNIVKNGYMVACTPGWCTGYSNAKDSIKEIREALKKEIERIKAIPTELIYNRQHQPVYC